VSQTAESPALARSRAHDAAGRHDEAINELARATQAGDLACTRALGIRLLTGNRGPLMPKEGLEFLGDACDRGLGEAAARAAGILALGIRIPPNWPVALQWLCRSAEAGWDPSRRQLLALCDDRALAARAVLSARPDWREVGAAVRLDDWRLSPPALIKSADPRVSVFEGFTRPEICRFVISLADGRLERARVYDAAHQQDIIVPHRSNTLATFAVESAELVHVLIQTRMAAACGISERYMEAPSVLHYAPGEQIRDHFDFVAPDAIADYAGEMERNGQRRVTFLLYLNDDYEGGETTFPKLGLSHKGRCGDGLYFVNTLSDETPDLRTLHAGCPTTRGEKWIITQFVRSRPTR
jgi:prolyl 4-hydroxylase